MKKKAEWIRVSFNTPAEAAEVAAEYIHQLTGFGVELKEWDQEDGPVEVIGYVPMGAELQSYRRSLELLQQRLQKLYPEGEFSLFFKDLAYEDWSVNWKKHFHPREVVPGLLVGPTWEEPELRDGQKSILIDPGQAFGTGQHATTVLCLQRITRLARRHELPQRVLDVGCGTGILALAALLMGAQSALGLDLDPEAVKAARVNAEVNGLADRFEAGQTGLDQITEQFPLILANLTAGELEPLLPDLVRCLSSGGELVISGLLQDQVEHIQGILQDSGLDLVEQGSLSGWVSLVMS